MSKGLIAFSLRFRPQPETILLVAGISQSSDEAIKSRRSQARKFNPNSMRFLGFREDIPELMAAADLLVHPSRLDVTGQVILEAIVNGLPSVVTGVCGFAEHVERAGAGIVLPEPFSQADLDSAVARLRDPALAETMSQAGIRYGRAVAPVTGLDQAADIIERGSATRPPAPKTVSPGTVPHRYAPISVIVTTYNRPDALDAVLRGLAWQSDGSFEVVVADDGSSPDTAALLDRWRTRLRQPLIHVWQEHRGFRAAEIRNRAIVASSGSYCIFLDGDCIPRNDFVLEHRQLAEIGWFVVGNRVLMSQASDRWRLTTPNSSRNSGPSAKRCARGCKATSIGSRHCFRRGSDRCGRFGRNTGGVRGRAIWRSGAPTSIGSMDSTAAM